MTTPAYRPGGWMEPGDTTAPRPDPTAPPRIDARDAERDDAPRPDDPFVLDCSVKDFFLRMLKSKEADGEREEEERVRVTMDNVLLYRGQHWQFANADCRIANALDEDDEDELQVVNIFGLVVDGKAKEWESSRPRVEITGRTRDYRLGGAARLSEALDKFVRRDSIKAHFRQREAKFGMFCKVYFRRSYLDAEDEDGAATRINEPVTERRRLLIGGVLACAECAHEYEEPDDLEGAPPDAEPPDYPACPECGAAAPLEVSPRFPFEREVQVGAREHVVPRLRHESVNPLAVKIDHRAPRYQDSDYHIYDTLVRRYEAEGAHPEAARRLRDVPAATLLPKRLTALIELERTTAGVDAFEFGDVPRTEAREDDLLRRRMFWLLPRVYRHYRARADEEVAGVFFKAGERIGDVLRAGACATVYGEDEIVRLDDESKNRRWCGAAFTLDPMTFHGKGEEDLRTPQFTLDDMATLAASHFDRAGAPQRVINTKMVDPDEFDGTTAKDIPMKEGAPENSKASEAVSVVASGQLGSDFMSFMMELPGLIRDVGGVSPTTFGQPDPHNKTKGGQELAAAASSSMQIPGLSLRAEEVETETTYQNLEYCQEFFTDADYALFESDYGTEAIETFRNLNVRRSLVATVAPGSWVPETREQEKENLKAFGETFLAAAGTAPPSFIRHAARLYNVPSEAFEPEADLKLAQARLARLRVWAERAYQAGAADLSPQAYEVMRARILAEPELSPRPLLENHPVHVEFLSNQWKGMYDDKQANPVLLDLIEGLVESHVAAMTKAEVKKAEIAARAQMPATAADARLKNAQADADADREDERADADARRQIAVRSAEAEMAPPA